MPPEESTPSSDAPVVDAPAETVETPETTTHEEVAEVLKSSGIDLPENSVTEEEKPKESPEVPAEPATPEAPKAGEPDKPAEPDIPSAPAEGPDFTLQVEDAEGVSHKIEKIEDLPEDFEPKNNRQIIEILANLQKIEGDKAKYESDQAEATQKAEDAKAIEGIQTGWANEFTELNVTDDARKEEIINYMAKENDKRQEENKPLIRTVEHALLSLEKAEAKETETTKAKEAKENARKNGGLVGGSSAPASNTPPVYKAGSATNGVEAARAMGLL